MVLGDEEWQRLKDVRLGLAELLLGFPEGGADLPRDRRPARDLGL